jgi:hypothetical protein
LSGIVFNIYSSDALIAFHSSPLFNRAAIFDNGGLVSVNIPLILSIKDCHKLSLAHSPNSNQANLLAASTKVKSGFD